MSEEEIVTTDSQEEPVDETANYIVDGMEETPEETTEETKDDNTDKGDVTEEAEKPEDQPPVKKVSKSEKRIKKLLQEKYALIDKLKQYESAPQPKEEVQEPADELDPNDFDTLDDYIAAVEAAEDIEEEPQEETPQIDNAGRQIPVEVMKTADRLDLEFDKAREKYPDFDDLVIKSDTPFTETIIMALGETENPGEVAYQLAKNPMEVYKLARLSPAKQFVAIGKLDAKVSSGTTETKQPKPKSSKAPKPINTVGGNTGVEPDLDKLSFEEYEARMNKLDSGDEW